MTRDLAIIVPAYKPAFLAAALRSVLQQTDNRYSLYIFDDASPHALAEIAKSTLGSSPYHFHRFDENMGGSSLPKHWQRCVDKTNEPWIWLFADDDLMDATCVEAFYRTLQDHESAVYRFDAWRVDERDRRVGIMSLHAESESWLEFAYARLHGWRPACMPQLIFSRAALLGTGGFQNFPLAWCTDDAAVIGMARHSTIRHIAGPRISWRWSAENITPRSSAATHRKKVEAVCLFLIWLCKQLAKDHPPQFADDKEVYGEAMRAFLWRMLACEGPLAAASNWSLLCSTLEAMSDGSRFALARDVALLAAQNALWAISSRTTDLAKWLSARLPLRAIA